MEHGPGRVRMGTRRGTLSFIELPVDTGRRGYMNCVPINIGCCCEVVALVDESRRLQMQHIQESLSGCWLAPSRRRSLES